MQPSFGEPGLQAPVFSTVGPLGPLIGWKIHHDQNGFPLQMRTVYSPPTSITGLWGLLSPSFPMAVGVLLHLLTSKALLPQAASPEVGTVPPPPQISLSLFFNTTP